eukprot:TRINITY_DN5849_c0_g1_i7.p2 TRINITY_DN5849_c0_g1~~TRINITY_DN5849_c0_g1_i7.p2  ORF type:complete len:125 (-),score=11.78 TRINITY_DN5849_c0_g1_i7:394-768(-)
MKKETIAKLNFVVLAVVSGILALTLVKTARSHVEEVVQAEEKCRTAAESFLRPSIFFSFLDKSAANFYERSLASPLQKILNNTLSTVDAPNNIKFVVSCGNRFESALTMFNKKNWLGSHEKSEC